MIIQHCKHRASESHSRQLEIMSCMYGAFIDEFISYARRNLAILLIADPFPETKTKPITLANLILSLSSLAIYDVILGRDKLESSLFFVANRKVSSLFFRWFFVSLPRTEWTNRIDYCVNGIVANYAKKLEEIQRPENFIGSLLVDCFSSLIIAHEEFND